MIILITPQENYKGETQKINDLFKQGLELLHIRKYGYSAQEMSEYIAAIDSIYRNRLVLHTRHELAENYDVKRLHFSEQARLKCADKDYTADYILSTSTHSMNDFNALGYQWQYSFLSPMFPSISKNGYGNVGSLHEKLKDRKNYHTQLIGLGGINVSNAQILKQKDVDGVALMGAIWKNNEPFINFK